MLGYGNIGLHENPVVESGGILIAGHVVPASLYIKLRVSKCYLGTFGRFEATRFNKFTTVCGEGSVVGNDNRLLLWVVRVWGSLSVDTKSIYCFKTNKFRISWSVLLCVDQIWNCRKVLFAKIVLSAILVFSGTEARPFECTIINVLFDTSAMPA